MVVNNTLGSILAFLSELKQNNNKDWFEAHRSNFNAARDAFEGFIDSIIDELRGTYQLNDLSAKQCIARIYRDIRFSKDKSPYKTNFGAMIAPGGWKTSAFGYNVSIEPVGQSMTAGGLYSPLPEQLARFREVIDRDPSVFKQVTGASEFFETFGEVQGERLKTNPRGYGRNHPEIALLQLKQVTAIRRFSDAEVVHPDFQEQVILACDRMKPFLEYMHSIC